MNHQNEQKVIQKETPDFCIKCKQMYGHQTFKNMCSKCFKMQKLETQLLEKKEIKQNLQEVLRKNTESEEKEKNEKSQKKEEISFGRKSNINQEGQSKVQRQRTREKQEKKNQNKCFSCSKKTGMLGYECKHCSNNFCKFHRIPEDHQCGVDFVAAGKKSLAEANPEIKTRKISGIDS